MVKVAVKLDKEFGIIVNTNGKRVMKQFDEEVEVNDFLEKLHQFPEATYEIITRTKRGIEGRPTSDAFIEVLAGNVQGGKWYKCVPVRPRKGQLFCTECHDYKTFHKDSDQYGSVYNCCPDCGMPDTEYNIKIANSLKIGR